MQGERHDPERLVEAMIFASPAPVASAAIARALPEDVDAEAVLGALQARYAGRGVELAEIGGGWQFRTAADLAPALTRVVQQPRRLPRAAMEALAVIAYHQPTTRAEIEAIRGASLGQTTMDALLEAGLVEPKGRKEVPGRPTLFGTTQAFLTQFGLRALRELPRREDLLVEVPSRPESDVESDAEAEPGLAPTPDPSLGGMGEDSGPRPAPTSGPSLAGMGEDIDGVRHD